MVGGSATTSGAGSDLDPLVWESFLWGLLSAVSLNIGSVIGVTCLPSQRARAVLMSFGGGALLFALSIELFGSVLLSSEGKDSTVVWAMEGSAVVGGVFFAALNHLLNVLGADVRKPSTKKVRFARLRALLLRRLTLRLSKIPFFSVLTLKEIGDLIQSAMYKERFGEGDIIMSSQARDSGIFFILSGMVRLQIFGQDKECLSPKLVPGDSNVSQVITSTSGWMDPEPNVLNSWDLGPNQICGDMTVLCGSYLQAQAVALEDTKVLRLPGHEVARLVQENAAVRDQISLRAVERLRQVAELRHLPDHTLASLSHRCSLVRYQPGDSIFHGSVDAVTPVLCLVLGSTECRYKESSHRRIHRASRLLCTEHLKTGLCSLPFSLVALEPSSVLFINRDDINEAMGSASQALRMVGVPSDLALPGQVPVAERAVPLPINLCVSIPGKGEAPESTVGTLDDTEVADVGEATPPSHPPEMLPCPHHSDRSSLASGGSERKTVRERLMGPEGSGGSLKPLLKRRFSEETSGQGPLGALSVLAHDLCWNEPDAEDAEDQLASSKFGRLGTAQMGQVTDLELEEHALDVAENARDNRRNSSKASVARISPKDGALVREAEAMPRVSSKSSKRFSPAPPPRESAVVAKGDEPVTVGAAEGGTHAAASQDNNRHRAVMIWLGILIDAVPESLVIGILINKAAGAEPDDRFAQSAASALPFVIGVFLSNLPESMSSSGSMKLHGMRVSTILLMWLATTVLTAAGASIGAVLFPPGSSGDRSAELVVVSVEGLAAGAMLTMIAQTMMPEAFEQGGDIVGLSCLGGFLCALSVRLIPLGGS